MGNKNTYSSSIIESANLWINIHQLMERYIKKFNSKIYYLSYDDLVTNTQNEIENLKKELEGQKLKVKEEKVKTEKYKKELEDEKSDAKK